MSKEREVEHFNAVIVSEVFFFVCKRMKWAIKNECEKRWGKNRTETENNTMEQRANDTQTKQFFSLRFDEKFASLLLVLSNVASSLPATFIFFFEDKILCWSIFVRTNVAFKLGMCIKYIGVSFFFLFCCLFVRSRKW